MNTPAAGAAYRRSPKDDGDIGSHLRETPGEELAELSMLASKLGVFLVVSSAFALIAFGACGSDNSGSLTAGAASSAITSSTSGSE
jgi:hypothetical protein